MPCMGTLVPSFTSQSVYTELTVNIGGQIRYVTENGNTYLVAPVTMIVPGVLNGSKGALYYPPHEIARNFRAWNRIPLTVNHPFDQLGRHVSARHGDVLHRQGIGEVRNANIDHKGKLRAEGWFDVSKTRRVDNRVLRSLESGVPVELSTGLYTENHPVPPGATYNGRPYEFVAVNYRPDHLAILPDQVGACILPGQEIQGRIAKASKARYTGEAVRIRTASGKVLAVTANHPVLTANGFVPAGQLTESQDLLHYVGEDKPLATNGNEDNAPALSEDVFKTLESLWGTKIRKRPGPLDFHGDAAFFQGDVEIVNSQSTLGNDGVPQSSESFSQSSLSGGRHSQFPLSCGSSAEKAINRVSLTDVGCVSNSGKPLTISGGQLAVHQSGRFGTASHHAMLPEPFVDGPSADPSFPTDFVSSHTVDVRRDHGFDEFLGEPLIGDPALTNFRVFGPGAELDVSLSELVADRMRIGTRFFSDVPNRPTGGVCVYPTVDSGFRNPLLRGDTAVGLSDSDPLPDEHLPDRRFAESKLFRQLLEGFPGKVAVDKVVSVDWFFHDGLVFDFESTTGYILAEKLIVSNCSIQDGCGVLVNANPNQPRDAKGRFTTVEGAAESVGLAHDTPWQVVHDEMLDRGDHSGAARLKYVLASTKAMEASQAVAAQRDRRGKQQGSRLGEIYRRNFDYLFPGHRESPTGARTPEEHREAVKHHANMANVVYGHGDDEARDLHRAAAKAHSVAAKTSDKATHNAASGLTPVDTGAPKPPDVGKPKKTKGVKPIKFSRSGSHEASQSLAEYGNALQAARAKAPAAASGTTSGLTENPFVSEAQRRACYAADDPNWDCKEWEDATPKGKKLPAHKPGATENLLHKTTGIYEVLTGNQYNGIGLFKVLVENAEREYARDDHGRFATVGEAAKSVGLHESTPWQVVHDEMKDQGKHQAAARVKYLAASHKAIELSKAADKLEYQKGRGPYSIAAAVGTHDYQPVYRESRTPASGHMIYHTPVHHEMLAEAHEKRAGEYFKVGANSPVGEAHLKAARAHREAAGTPQRPTHNTHNNRIGLFEILTGNFNPDQPRDEAGRWSTTGAEKTPEGKALHEKELALGVAQVRTARANALLLKAKDMLERATTPARKALAKSRVGTAEATLQQAKQDQERAHQEVKDATPHTERTSGGGGVQGGTGKAGGQVEKAASRTGDETTDRRRAGSGESAGHSTAETVAAGLDKVNARLGRYQKFFRNVGDEDAADMVKMLRDHVNEVGVKRALEGISGGLHEGVKGEPGHQAAYEGWWDVKGEDKGGGFWGYMSDKWVEKYLDRHGISLQSPKSYYNKDKPIISSSSPSQGGHEPFRKGDFTPKDPTFKHKLEESRLIPGLERSEDVSKVAGQKVTHLTDEVMGKLDKAYGKGKWIVKAYGDEAADSYGIFFPQRAVKIKEDAQNAIWSAERNLAKQGYSLQRNRNGKVVGVEREDGQVFKFGKIKQVDEDKFRFGKGVTKAPDVQHVGDARYNRAIRGEVRKWADKAAIAADNEHGAALPEKGKEFMVQPAYKAVGVTSKDRAKGVVIKYGDEGRVHVVTKDGKAEVVPHATWVKGDHFPVVFENKQTRAMAKAALDAVNALPKSERQGQIYAPDVMRTTKGYKIVEVNPSDKTGTSFYLGTNHLVIDSYVSHILGREPGHVQFIRSVLTDKRKGRGKTTENAWSDEARAAALEARRAKAGQGDKSVARPNQYQQIAAKARVATKSATSRSIDSQGAAAEAASRMHRALEDRYGRGQKMTKEAHEAVAKGHEAAAKSHYAETKKRPSFFGVNLPTIDDHKNAANSHAYAAKAHRLAAKLVGNRQIQWWEHLIINQEGVA